MGLNPKEELQVAARRKYIDYDSLPFPGIGKLVFLEDRLSELADYRRNSRALHCSLPLQRKHQARFVGVKAKEELQVAPTRKGIA